MANTLTQAQTDLVEELSQKIKDISPLIGGVAVFGAAASAIVVHPGQTEEEPPHFTLITPNDLTSLRAQITAVLADLLVFAATDPCCDDLMTACAKIKAEHEQVPDFAAQLGRVIEILAKSSENPGDNRPTDSPTTPTFAQRGPNDKLH